jgi:hypothetical protein
METKALATYIVSSRIEDFPTDVIHEAKRSLLNFVGCAIGGSREPAVETAITALRPFSGEPTTALLARPERFDPLYASVINGISGHVFEYDDTTPMNYIHPTPPVASALFAFASANGTNGRDFLHAFLLGFEAESRIGNAVYPAHYNAGWHITSTAGVFGAAAAIGMLHEMDTSRQCWPNRVLQLENTRLKVRVPSRRCLRPNTISRRSRPASEKTFRFDTTPTSRIPAGLSCSQPLTPASISIAIIILRRHRFVPCMSAWPR